MTISYETRFIRLMLRWKGSLWRTLKWDILVFLLLYYAIKLMYIFLLDDDQQDEFDRLAKIFNSYLPQIPLTFVLGFYVSLIVRRWWIQFELVTWPEDLLSFINSIFNKDEDQCIKMLIVRYLNLSAVLCYRDISTQVRARFPSLAQVVHAGLMTKLEAELYRACPAQSMRWQLPINWVQEILQNRNDEKAIITSIYNSTLHQIRIFRQQYRRLYCFDWVPVPLVYTQVVSLAVYGFFLFALIARQTLKGEMELYFPFFTILQFIFFVGWYKVGQDLMRPFGRDDDDIELNYLLDRDLRCSLAFISNESYARPPFLKDNSVLKDPDHEQALKKLVDGAANQAINALPHTTISAKHPNHLPILHAAIVIKDEQEAEQQDLVESKATIRKRMASLYDHDGRIQF